MELNLVRKLVENRKPGTFTNIVYTVECPVRAEYKKQGIKVRKTVSAVVRFDINYGNIASVKIKKETESNDVPKKPRANNFVVVTENMIYHNTNTNKDYLNVYTVKNSIPKKFYEMITSGKDTWSALSESDLKTNNILIDSYFNKKEHNEMFRIDVNNILSINGVQRWIWAW